MNPRSSAASTSVRVGLSPSYRFAVLACALYADPVVASPLPLWVDNAMQLDGRPWSVERAAVKIGGDGAWSPVVLRPGEANLVQVEVKTTAPLPLHAAVVELRLADGGRLLGSVPVPADGHIVLRGDLHSPTLQPLASLQGGAMGLPVLHSRAGDGVFAPAALGAKAWPFVCVKMTAALLDYTLCNVDTNVGRTAGMHLSMVGANLMPALPMANLLAGTMTSDVDSQSWVQASKTCRKLSNADGCPSFHGWITPVYWNLDLEADAGRLHGNLSGAALAVALSYSFGHFVAEPGRIDISRMGSVRVSEVQP